MHETGVGSVPGGSASPHKTLAAYVLEELRSRIILGELEAGSRLAVDQLSDELGSSRIPVREALRQLEAEGLVVSIPHRGVMVRGVHEQDIDDAYDLLEAAELLAVARAAKSVTPALLARLRRDSEEMLQLSATPTSKAMHMAHRSFHFAVFDQLGNGLLFRHIHMLWNSCERFVVAAMSDVHDNRLNVEQHMDYIPLLERQDAEGLADLTRRHLQESRSRAKRRLAR